MTDQTQTTTEPVAWTDVANLEKLKAKLGSATMWPHPHTGGSIPLYTTPQPLAIGLDREAVIEAMRENITIGDSTSCSISLDGFEEAADAILALSAPAEPVEYEFRRVGYGDDMWRKVSGPLADRARQNPEYEVREITAAPAEGYVLVPVERLESVLLDITQGTPGYARRKLEKLIAACLPAAPTGGRS